LSECPNNIGVVLSESGGGLNNTCKFVALVFLVKLDQFDKRIRHYLCL